MEKILLNNKIDLFLLIRYYFLSKKNEGRTMKEDFWEAKNEGNITIKLNDLCNTTCLHCFSSGRDRSHLNFEVLKNDFTELLYQLYKKGVVNYDISFIGGEITLISEKELTDIVKSFNESILDFLKIVSPIVKEKVKFSICFISNFIFDIKNTNYCDLLYSFTQTPWSNKEFNPYVSISEFNIDMFTSFDFGLGRFKSQKIEDLWKKNCEKYKGDLGLLVTLNKETCERFNELEHNEFFNCFNQIIFQLMLDFGDKEYLAPNYETLYKTINHIRDSDKPYQLSTKFGTKYFVSINNDSVLSCCVSEEVKLYENKPHFMLNTIKENKDSLSSVLDNQLKLRIKKSQNKICLSCDEFLDCNFCFEVFNKDIICPAFKIIPQ